MQVVVVDDNLLSATAVVSQLRHDGHLSTLVGTHADAIRAVHGTNPDFILVNLAANSFDPFDLIKIFRASPEVGAGRIVGFCGHLEHARRANAHEAGCDHIITNAVAMQQLTTALKTLQLNSSPLIERRDGGPDNPDKPE